MGIKYHRPAISLFRCDCGNQAVVWKQSESVCARCDAIEKAFYNNEPKTCAGLPEPEPQPEPTAREVVRWLEEAKQQKIWDEQHKEALGGKPIEVD